MPCYFFHICFVTPCYLFSFFPNILALRYILFAWQPRPQAQKLLAHHCRLATNQHVDYKLIGSITVMFDTSLYAAQQLKKNSNFCNALIGAKEKEI